MTDKQNWTKILDNINHARIVKYKYRLSPTCIMRHESETFENWQEICKISHLS